MRRRSFSSRNPLRLVLLGESDELLCRGDLSSIEGVVSCTNSYPRFCSSLVIKPTRKEARPAGCCCEVWVRASFNTPSEWIAVMLGMSVSSMTRRRRGCVSRRQRRSRRRCRSERRRGCVSRRQRRSRRRCRSERRCRRVSRGERRCRSRRRCRCSLVVDKRVNIERRIRS